MSVNDVCTKYGTGISMVATAAIDDYDVVGPGTNPNECTKLATNGKAIGVVRNGTATAGNTVTVYGNTGDVYLCRASTTISAGANVVCTTDGEIVTAGTSAGTVYYHLGIALKAATAANDIIPVLWQPMAVNAATS